MQRIVLLVCVIAALASQSAFAGAGIAAGAFADSFSKGMQENAALSANEAAIRRMRLEARARYGTGQIQRMEVLEKYADARMDEILNQLVNEITSRSR